MKHPLQLEKYVKEFSKDKTDRVFISYKIYKYFRDLNLVVLRGDWYIPNDESDEEAFFQAKTLKCRKVLYVIGIRKTIDPKSREWLGVFMHELVHFVSSKSGNQYFQDNLQIEELFAYNFESVCTKIIKSITLGDQ